MLRNRLITCLSIGGMFFSFLVVSCSLPGIDDKSIEAKSILNDESWLTGIPCEAPCWHGLIPGITQREELGSIIKDSPYILLDDADEKENVFYDITTKENVSGYEIWLKCKKDPGYWCVFLQFRENILYEMIIPLESEVTMEKAIENLGMPDGFLSNRINAETKGCDLALLWKDRQMFLRYYEETFVFGDDLCDRIAEANYKVPPELVIQEVSIMQKDYVIELMKSGTYLPWSGFISNRQ